MSKVVVLAFGCLARGSRGGARWGRQPVERGLAAFSETRAVSGSGNRAVIRSDDAGPGVDTVPGTRSAEDTLFPSML